MFDEKHTVEFRKQLWDIYNGVTKDIYGNGVVELRITIDDDTMLFFARHNRVPALAALEARFGPLKQNVDYALHQEFKLRLKERLETEMNIHPLALLKDYDADYKLAVTTVVFEKK